MRRPHELEELPASLDERRVERGGSSSLSAPTDGGTTVSNLVERASRGAAAPNNPEAQRVLNRFLPRAGGGRV